MHTFQQKKITVDLIKALIKQQQEEAIATQCGAKTSPRKDVHQFHAICRISACMFTFAPPSLRYMWLPPQLLSVRSPPGFSFSSIPRNMVLQLMAKGMRIHIPLTFSPFSPPICLAGAAPAPGGCRHPVPHPGNSPWSQDTCPTWRRLDLPSSCQPSPPWHCLYAGN